MKRLLLLLMAVPLTMPVAVVASASPPDTPLTQLLACRHIAPDAARLTCFDRTSAALAPARVFSPAPSSRPAAPAMKNALDPKLTFGLSSATIVKREASAAGVGVKDLSHITARVLRMQLAADGSAVFELDNGQVWKQLSPDGSDVYTKAGDKVEISRGWLGSYWLETPFRRRCNVIRLR
jgi:hypothetical protein